MSGESTCSACGACLQEGQDWCLQCGAGAPGSGRMGPGWRSAALLFGVTGALVLGAAAAAYAALQQSSPAKPKTLVVAQSTTTTTTTSSTTTAPPTTTPFPTPAPGSTGGKSPSLNTPSTPPKIPGSAPTPESKTTSSSTRSSSTTTTSSTSSSTTEPESGKQPVAVLLDTNAAQIYNPGNLPAGRFGDPSLAIDGDTTTAWTVKLEGSVAPAVGVGLTLDLKAPLKIAKLTLITESVGMTVQVYGTKSAQVPQALSSEEWVHLSKAHLVKKRKASITLSEDKKAFRTLLVWISQAPTGSGGQFTGSEVSIDEIQLYEPSSSGSQG